MLNRSLSIGLVIAIAFGSFPRLAIAQPALCTIHGVVKDKESGGVLENATVMLSALRGKGVDTGKLAGMRRNGAKGFVFRGLSPGRYRLIATFLDYAPDTVMVTVDAGEQADKSVDMWMKKAAQTLDEVVVRAKVPPMTLRGDTTVFNADAYPTRVNATLEDLLKNLPGVEVDRDGNVTLQGQRVDKIYLDGKEFFLSGPKMATQNLPADIIKKVEAFNSQTEKSKLTGIKEETGTKSLNIVLKDNRRNGYFGKLYGGAGHRTMATPGAVLDAYSAGGMVTSLGKTWAMATGNINNVSDQFTGDDNGVVSSLGGLQTVHNLQVNWRHGPSHGLSYTANVNTSGNHLVMDRASSVQTMLSDSSLLEQRASHNVSKDRQLDGNIFLEYALNPATRLNWRGGVSNAESEESSVDDVDISTLKGAEAWTSNRGQTKSSNTRKAFGINNRLDFRTSLHKPGRSLYIGLSHDHRQSSRPQTASSTVDYLDSTGNLLSHQQTNQLLGQTTADDSYSATVSYMEPLRKEHILDLSYNLIGSVNRSDRQSYDLDSLTGHYDRPDSASSNHFTTVNTKHRFDASYNVTEGLFHYQLRLGAEWAELLNRNRTVDSTLIQRQLNWRPGFIFTYQRSKTSSLSMSYDISTSNPSLQQLQPVQDPTNPYLIRQGNPGLQRELTHSMTATYHIVDPRHSSNLQSTFTGSLTQHAIISSTEVTGGIQKIGYINADGVWNGSALLSYGFPLGDMKKGNGNVMMTGRYGRNVAEVNGAMSVTASVGWGLNGRISLRMIKGLSLETAASVNYTGNLYSLSNARNTDLWSLNYSINGAYDLPGEVTVSSLFSIQANTQQTGKALVVPLWNASGSKVLGKKRQVQIKIAAVGILNTSNFVTQVAASNTISTIKTNLPGRLVMVGCIWRFRNFGEK